MRYAIDPSKTRDELGWEPTTLFDEGIKKTINGTWIIVMVAEYYFRRLQKLLR
jgi:dTDP-D-glucose 4,6-dehydratase